MDDDEYLLFAAVANRSSALTEEGDFHHHLFERDFGEEEEEEANGTSGNKRAKTRLSDDSTLKSGDDASMKSFDVCDPFRVDNANDFRINLDEKKSKTKTKTKECVPTAPRIDLLIDVLYCSSCKHDLPAATHFTPERKTCVNCLRYHKRYARQKRKLDKQFRVTYEASHRLSR